MWGPRLLNKTRGQTPVRLTSVGADGPEAAYHFLAPRRPAVQLDISHHMKASLLRLGIVGVLGLLAPV